MCTDPARTWERRRLTRQSRDDVDKSEADTNDRDTASAQGDSPLSAPPDEKGAVQPGGRKVAVPSSILEKGLVYFFLRARVDVTTPHTTDDIARTYLLLRP